MMIKISMKKVLISLLMVLIAAPAFAQIDRDHDFKTAKNMDIFNSIYKNLDLMYVDTLDAAMVSRLCWVVWTLIPLTIQRRKSTN